MANLLTRKVMENMSRQYRKDNGISNPASNSNISVGNINAVEEALLLSLMKNKLNNVSSNNIKFENPKEIQRLKLEDLVGYKEKGDESKLATSHKISLEELAHRHK